MSLEQILKILISKLTGSDIEEIPDGLESILRYGADNYKGTEAGETAVAWTDITGKPSTFAPIVGTAANQAKAGNYTPAWTDVTGKPSTFAPIVGTSATDAKAGNYVPAWVDITSKPTTFIPPTATTSVIGGVKQAATQASSTSTDVEGLQADFNALLAKLKTAGLMV